MVPIALMAEITLTPQSLEPQLPKPPNLETHITMFTYIHIYIYIYIYIRYIYTEMIKEMLITKQIYLSIYLFIYIYIEI